jgi:hypothetical protein
LSGKKWKYWSCSAGPFLWSYLYFCFRVTPDSNNLSQAHRACFLFFPDDRAEPLLKCCALKPRTGPSYNPLCHGLGDYILACHHWARFDPRPVHVGFVVAPGRVFY